MNAQRTPLQYWLQVLPFGLALLAGCTGYIGGGKGGSARKSASDPSVTGAASDAGGSGVATGAAGAATGAGTQPPAVPAAALRRLTSFEYNNAVAALLGTGAHPADAFVAQSRPGVFDNDVTNLTVSSTLVEQYLEAAELLAGEATSGANLPRLLTCGAVSVTEACARASVINFASRAYRRPLVQAEADDLLSTFSDGLAAGDIVAGIQYSLERILISPSFLYWVELGDPEAKALANGRVALTRYEVAARLSRLLTGSIPDPPLTAAAVSGALDQSTEILTQAKRLLRGPDGTPTVAAKNNLAQFHEGWLGLAALRTMSKGVSQWSGALRSSMLAETDAFLDDLVWSRADMSAMFTATYGYVNATLAPVYNVQVSGSDLVRTELDKTTRSGLLTQASIMALTSNDNPKPMKRASFVFGRLLCSPPSPPPPNAPTSVPDGTQGSTEREKFQRLTSVAPCVSCHTALNGVGWTFASYDAIGAARTVDALGAALDLQGALSGTDVDGPFASVVELSKRLAQSEQARSCLVRQWFRFANGRFDTDADTPALADLEQRFISSKYRFEDLMLAMVQVDEFKTRPAY